MRFSSRDDNNNNINSTSGRAFISLVVKILLEIIKVAMQGTQYTLGVEKISFRSFGNVKYDVIALIDLKMVLT